MSEPTVDVLGVLRKHRADCGILGCDWCAELDGVIAAVAELIEAATAFRRGEYHDPETEFSVQYNERRRREAARLHAALARVGGAK
ncbi:hypothetical protein [Lysobacter enzymogenes]|uniref:hypothetical protein n=1 Tax=Lysobacter enzymogenes TaxID=69 RepID=UPI001A97D06D|nr:hypothetical protein [Lysobacter enzymogenes]QQP96513.1 hypothetical protein JHW38_00185 [Lysobacter enzymogenes]